MIKKYDFKIIEKKWQDIWGKSNVFAASDDFSKQKFYALIEFPYPSAEGLHVGHPRSYVALDIISRKKRMQNFNVLYPIGWDAFGLPAENYAIKNKIHPKIITAKNISNFKKQLKSLGLSFDWSREISTIDPSYYKWTQWIFSKLFEHGLAVKCDTLVNWCLSCKCVLSNEEVVEGKCERCAGGVIQKNKSQWVLKITKYAQRLIDDLDLVDYPERVKLQQKNWIGRSEGAIIKFKIISEDKELEDTLEIFTTRPDTIFGVTYMVIAPEHKIIDKYKFLIKNIENINKYSEQTQKKNEFERSQMTKDKTGIEIQGLMGLNPITNEKIPIFVADYVLVTYGTGAIMAVPAHDERDWDFAKKYNIKIKEVISGGDISENPYTDDGVLINSDFLNDLNSDMASKLVIKKLKELGAGEAKLSYKLRDWIFSRQRYWGEPIPIIECKDCGFVLDKNLPVILPDIENFQPLENGESVLASEEKWCCVNCPKCGKAAKRETDTMPQWAGSSWYFLRYIDPVNLNEFASSKMLKYWLPVDWYNGGMEHTTLHLLYSRFWHKFLYDIGVVPTPEPYAKRTSHGMILGQNGEKMSKSRGNVVNPDEIISEYGADTIRLYEMFMGDFENTAPWNTASIKGCSRFLEKVWELQTILTNENEIRENMNEIINRTIKKVSEDIEVLKFNTAIAALMTCLNKIRETNKITRKEFDIITLLLSVFAPHISEELRSVASLPEASITSWPDYDLKFIDSSLIDIIIQINGKLKSKINVSADFTKEKIIELALEKISDHFNKEDFKNIVFVPKRLVNFVT